jgi:hypothetical protein
MQAQWSKLVNLLWPIYHHLTRKILCRGMPKSLKIMRVILLHQWVKQPLYCMTDSVRCY